MLGGHLRHDRHLRAETRLVMVVLAGMGGGAEEEGQEKCAVHCLFLAIFFFNKVPGMVAKKEVSTPWRRKFFPLKNRRLLV